MTVAVTDCSKRFHGGGSTGPFTWTWRFLANSDINVYLVANPNEADISQEVRELLSEGDDYLLAGAGSYTGGSLILVVALAVGTDLVIERNTAAVQNVSIRNQGNNFRPEVHETVFDRLTMMQQDRDRDIDTNTAEINGLKPRMTTAESNIDSLEVRASSLENRATSLEERATSVENRATALETRATTLEGRATTVENRATTLEGRMDDAETNIADLQGTVADILGTPPANLSADKIFFDDASAESVERNIVAANDAAARVTVVIKTDDSANVVTIVPVSGTINGEPSVDLTDPRQFVRLAPNPGANDWMIIG